MQKVSRSILEIAEAVKSLVSAKLNYSYVSKNSFAFEFFAL
jgi:hypothetical protein